MATYQAPKFTVLGTIAANTLTATCKSAGSGDTNFAPEATKNAPAGTGTCAAP